MLKTKIMTILPDKLVDRLRLISKTTGIPMCRIIADALEKHLKTLDK